jgi:hypothetical protein
MARVTRPLLAALLRRALPALRVLDTAVITGGLWPFWSEAMLALPDETARHEPERAVLAALGLRAVDPALAAGAAEAWGGPGPRLVVAEASPLPWLMSGALVLASAPAPPPAECILLLLGSGDTVEQHHLVLPEGGMTEALTAISAAAQSMAGAGWSCGVRAVSPRFATLTLVAPRRAFDALELSATILPQQVEAGGRRRILLGALPPWPMRIRVDAEGAAALFLDGRAHAEGAVFTPRRGEPVVLGLAGEGVVLRTVEIRPA